MDRSFGQILETLTEEANITASTLQVTGFMRDLLNGTGLSDDCVIDFLLSASRRYKKLQDRQPKNSEKFIHSIWVSDPKSPALPPEHLIRGTLAKRALLPDAWRQVFWVNSKALMQQFADAFGQDLPSVQVRLLAEFEDQAVYRTFDKLVTDRKFVLAADVAKFMCLRALGGLYTDLGVALHPSMLIVLSQARFAVFLSNQGLFQTSLVFVNEAQNILDGWERLILLPEILTSVVEPSRTRFESIDEVNALAGPGLTLVILAIADVLDGAIVIPEGSKLLSWGSLQSWYGEKAKFGNVLISQAPCSLIDPGRHRQLANEIASGAHGIAGHGKLPRRLEFLLRLFGPEPARANDC